MSVSERRQERWRESLEKRLGSVIVIGEAIYRRHNVSAILRSAESFGLHEIHLVSRGFRPSKGAARGSERWMELHRHTDTTTAVRALQARGVKVYAADLRPGAVSPVDVPLDGPIAVLFGSELNGVSDEARGVVDGFLTVPMSGLTESLNVSVAAAVMLYVLSDRRRRQLGRPGDLSPEQIEATFARWLAREDKAAIGLAARVGEPEDEDEALWSEALPCPT